DRGHRAVELAFEVGEIDLTTFEIKAEFHHGKVLVFYGTCQHVAIFRMDATRHQDLSATGDASCHQGRFRHGRRTVVHGGVGHLHAGELADHCLELEDCDERAWRDFSLIGGVRREELAAAYHDV